MPLIVLPKSCSCRWRPCPPAPSHPFLVWVLASAEWRSITICFLCLLLEPYTTLSLHITDSAHGLQRPPPRLQPPPLRKRQVIVDSDED